MPTITRPPGGPPPRTPPTDAADISADAATPATADADVKTVAPQRDEIMLDADKGGGLASAVRRVGIWYEFGIGGDSDAVDGIPRLTGADVRDDMLPRLKAGDVIVNGNNGGLSHVAVFVGDGNIIHSMATADTMRGRVGRVADAVFSPLRLIGRELSGSGPKVGVIKEGLDEFLDRYERDTWVIMRSDKLEPAAVAKGAARLEELVGKDYDFDFMPANDTFYCSEIVGEFYRTALGDDAPRIGARPVSKPFLEREAIVDPLDIFNSPDLKPVVANNAALHKFADALADAEIVTHAPHAPPPDSISDFDDDP